MGVIRISNSSFAIKTMLAGDYLPLYVPLVKGLHYAAWVDSGTKAVFPQLLEAMSFAGVADADLRFVIQTHSHADHIGCNVLLAQRTGCLIAGHRRYAHWHTDLERHYQEWARPVPELVPDTPQLRQSLLDWFDSPHELNVIVEEGAVFNLGGGVTLTGFSLPGHMLNDIAWLESSSRLLIGGDCITATEWPHFHMHLTVPGYRSTIRKFQGILRDHRVDTVFFTHFGPLRASDAQVMAEQAWAFLDKMDRSLLQVVASRDSVTLVEIWEQVAARMGKIQDYQALNTIHAHVQDFLARGLIREVEPMRYALH